MYRIPEETLEVFIVAFFFFFVAAKLFHLIPVLPKRHWIIIILSALNGIIGGIIGTGSIIRMAAMLSLGLSKGAFMATSSTVALVMSIGKISAYMTEFTWTPNAAFAYLLVSIGIVTGMRTGKKILPHVSHDLFEKFLLCVILLGAIRMLLTPTLKSETHQRPLSQFGSSDNDEDEY